MFKVMIEGNAVRDCEVYKVSDDNDYKLIAVDVAVNITDGKVFYIRCTKKYLNKIAEKLNDTIKKGQRLLVIGNFDIVTKEIEKTVGNKKQKQLFENKCIYATNIYVV